MNWFGKRPAPAARPALARGLGGAAVGGWPSGYEAQVRSGYCENPVVQRAVRLVVDTLAGAPLQGDAGLMALCSARQAGRPVIETVAAQLLLHGNAFVAVLRDADGGVAGLFPLRPERVRVELDALGWPAGYRYTVSGRETRFAAAAVKPELIHLRGFSPVDDHYGTGCLGAASAAVAIHNAADRWNKALLDNAARPSGALVYDPGDGAALSPEQFRRLREEMDAAFAGAANAGRPLLLEGGLKWEALSLTPAEMDFAGLKGQAAREIALAFGVPPLLLGLPGDNTYANLKEASRALWRNTLLPMGASILGALREGLDGWFPAAELAIDLDRVPALVEDRERLWSLVTKADFLTREEKREMVDWA